MNPLFRKAGEVGKGAAKRGTPSLPPPLLRERVIRGNRVKAAQGTNPLPRRMDRVMLPHQCSGETLWRPIFNR